MAFSLRVPSASARVPDMRMGVRPPLVRYPAVRVGGAPPSVDATKLGPLLVLYLQPTCTNFTSGVVASYLKNCAS